MNKKLFFCCFILSTQLTAMKRTRTSNNSIQSYKKQCSQSSTQQEGQFNYSGLPTDLQSIIFDFSTKHTTEKKPKDATQKVNALAQTNKLFNTSINTTSFNKELINKFSEKFCCSHETIARYLQTKVSKECLSTQKQLKTLFYITHNAVSKKRLNKVMKHTDVEFTYNYDQLQQTPLMIALRHHNPLFAQTLIKKADVNNGNSYGITPLNLMIESPINRTRLMTLLNEPTLNINKQNRRGETALLHAIKHQTTLTPPLLPFINILSDLFAAGANPTIADAYGITPLIAAKKSQTDPLGQLLISVIEEEIIKNNESKCNEK